MKVIVLGAGVVGITTAYDLASAGAEVTVLDRQPGPALETSYANAGQVSPGYSTPWAAPGIPFKALKWMFQRDAPLAIRPDGSLWQLRWMYAMLRNCNASRYAQNKQRMMRLAEYSRDCLRDLRQQLGLQYEQRSGGTLQVFRSRVQFEAAQRDIEVLRECGVDHQLLGADELAAVEPALAQARDRLVGGLRLPNDETGDCRLFTSQLEARARQLGVAFSYGTTVDAVQLDGRRVTGVLAGGQVLRADACVVACGSYSRELLLPLGIELPLYPVKGYSLTVPVVDPALAPRSTVLDETYKIALTAFDRRIRVGGMAELAGFDLRLDPRRRRTLEKVTRQLFPGGDLGAAEFWTGLRPMTPDGTPLLGPTQHAGLWLNTGHGTLGWTMACGSARVLTDQLLGRRTEIEARDLALARSSVERPPTARGWPVAT